MYLKKDRKKDGRVYLSITESYRDARGRSRNRTVRSLGYLDDLEREWGPGALGRAEAIRDELTAERRAAAAPVAVELHMAQKVDKRAANRMAAGDAVPMAYYHALGIESAVRSGMRGRRAGFDV